MRTFTISLVPLALAAAVGLAWATPASAQMRTASTTSSNSTFGGSVGGTSSIGGTSSLGGSSFSGGSLSSGFSGSSLGSNFSGGSTSPSGSRGNNSATSGNNRTGLSSTQVGANTFLGAYYANPLATGAPGSSGKTALGTPLYNTNTTTTGRTGPTSLYGSAGSATLRTGTGALANAVANVATARPTYTVSLGFRPDPVPSAVVLGDIRQSLNVLPLMDPANGNRVQVALDGKTVVLKGSVEDDREKLLVETMARMTPGVRDVRNELDVRTTTSSLAAR